MTLYEILDEAIDMHYLPSDVVNSIKDNFLVIKGPELFDQAGRLDIARVLYACDIVRKNGEYYTSADIFQPGALIDEEQKQKRDRYMNLAGAVVAFLSKRQDGIIEDFE